jgi:hypothetical protein
MGYQINPKEDDNMPEGKTFNINELLERKKELENKIKIELDVDKESLLFVEQTITDHTNPKNNKKIVLREKKSLVDYSQKFNGMAEELAKVKTAIQKHNADAVLGKLHERESVRKKIEYLNKIKMFLTKDKKYQRSVTRTGKEGETLETTEITNEPMFSRDEVDKQLNQLAAQERKINTEIQKLNLEAKVTLGG